MLNVCFGGWAGGRNLPTEIALPDNDTVPSSDRVFASNSTLAFWVLNIVVM